MFSSNKKKLKNNQKGSMLVIIMVATFIFSLMLMGTISLALLQQKLNIRRIAGAQAMQIAEAGANYYRWVLYHDNKEYCNKETCIGSPNYGPYGPYPYTDFSGETTGEYELYITPPKLNGSTIVTIKSVGWTSKFPNIKKTIEVQCGIPSWTTYSNLTHDYVVYGSASITTGPVHSNTGVLHYGTAYGLVTCSQPNYGSDLGVSEPSDPNWDGNDPPENVPVSSSFQGGRKMGIEVNDVSFTMMDNYAQNAYILATSSGIIFDPRYAGDYGQWSVPAERSCKNSGDTCDEGYHIHFINNDRFEFYKVSSVQASCGGKPSYSIQSESYSNTYDIPPNGIIFVKHNVWVDGTVNNGASGTRATIVAFEDPFSSGSADIYVNHSILYTNTDGTDSIGLIAQHDFRIGIDSDDYLTISASIIAVKGKKARENYSSFCGADKTKLTINGSQSSYLRPYTGDYAQREYNFDHNTKYNPPPHYPTTGQYTFIQWEEK